MCIVSASSSTAHVITVSLVTWSLFQIDEFNELELDLSFYHIMIYDVLISGFVRNCHFLRL